MGKGIIDLYPKETYNNPAVQKMWDEYRNLFDFDIDGLFGNNYPVKLRFGHFFRNLIDGHYKIALSVLRGYKENFISESDRNLYEKFEQHCMNYANMSKISSGDWIKDDFNHIYFVIEGGVDKAVIKHAFNPQLECQNTLGSCNHFSIQTTDLLCYRNVTEEELSTINLYFQNHQHAYEELTALTNQYFHICSKLLECGFTEAINCQGNFYKYLTADTAFIINVKDYGKYIGIVYGMTTVSSSSDLKDYFEHHGKDDNEISLRESVNIHASADEDVVSKCIQDFYAKNKALRKDALLEVAKAKRKQFLNCFITLLKPFQFKKKGNQWSKDINDLYTLTLYVSKSQYSDVYNIDMWINHKANSNCICYSKRYSYQNSYQINWQLVVLEELVLYLKQTVIKDITAIVSLSYEELDTNVENSCHCDRTRCDNCWMMDKC